MRIGISIDSIEKDEAHSFLDSVRNAIYIYTGDSIAALDDCSSFVFWGQGFTGGLLKPVAAARQAISGSEINEGDVSLNFKDLLYPHRRNILQSCIAPGTIVAVAIGTNTISAGAAASVISGLASIYNDILMRGGKVEAYTILPSSANEGLADRFIVNDWIKNQSSNEVIVVDGAFAWSETCAGHTDVGGLHPNTAGAMKVGRARRAAYVSRGAVGSILHGAQNAEGNLIATWDLSAGVGGAMLASGGTGPVPTGISVSSSVGGLSISSSIADWWSEQFQISFPALLLDVDGVATSTGDIVIQQNVAISPEVAGSIYSHYCYLAALAKNSADFASHPTFLTAIGSDYGSQVSKWASSSTATAAGKISGGFEVVARGRSIPSTATFGNSSIQTKARVSSGDAVSFRLVYGQPACFKSERLAYGPTRAVHTEQGALAGTLQGPRVGATLAWNPVVGAVATGRPGQGWIGGGVTFQYQWQRSIDGGASWGDVVGEIGISYVVAGSPGDMIRLKVTGSNDWEGGSQDFAYSPIGVLS